MDIRHVTALYSGGIVTSPLQILDASVKPRIEKRARYRLRASSRARSLSHIGHFLKVTWATF